MKFVMMKTVMIEFGIMKLGIANPNVAWNRKIACLGLLTAFVVLSASAAAETFDAFSEPVQTIHLSAAEPGRIDRVWVKRGDRVQPDSIVMELDSKVLQASLQIAKQEAESSVEVQSLQIERDLKQNRHDQVERLLRKGAVSPEEAKRSKADATIAQLTLDAAIEKKKLAELRLKELDGKLQQRRVRGQVHGLVIDVLREPGEYVSTGDPHVATVVVLDQLRCTFFVPTEVADRYEMGQTVDVMMEQAGSATLAHIPARVEYIAAVTQADSGRVRMDVLIENADGQYRSGLRCRFDCRSVEMTRNSFHEESKR